MATIYALSYVPPEVSAYGMAKYSRSRASLRDSLLELSGQQAADFLDTYYFAYGHASIADLAHIGLAIEEVSLLAAMEIVDEPLWDGQERSTRYQNFEAAAYYRPEEADQAYDAAIAGLHGLYRDLYAESFEALSRAYPRPQALNASAYRRTLNARAFDIARYALPLATLTSLGQITSARVLEGQIARLMSSPLAELQAVGRQMRDAVVSQAPFNLVTAKWRQAGRDVPAELLQDLEFGPLAPTLTKYTHPLPYLQELPTLLAPVVRQYFAAQRPAASPAGVTLHLPTNWTDHHLATVFYGQTHLSYRQILDTVEQWGEKEKDEVLDLVFGARGAHDEWLRAFRTGPLIFDIVTDVGAFRDLNRHRRMQKTVQPLTPERSYQIPSVMRSLAMDIGAYTARLDTHYRRLSDASPQHLYQLPLAHTTRALLAMDIAEAAYIIELRSRSAGHFSYRQTAYEMYQALHDRLPSLARHIRVTPPDDFDPFER